MEPRWQRPSLSQGTHPLCPNPVLAGALANACSLRACFTLAKISFFVASRQQWEQNHDVMSSLTATPRPSFCFFVQLGQMRLFQGIARSACWRNSVSQIPQLVA